MPFDGKTHEQTERLAKVATLRGGSHHEQDAMCVMEAVAYVAGEEWSDHPQCACPIITNAAIRLNDSINWDAQRDALLRPLIPLLIGTRSTPAIEKKRVDLALSRVGAPRREQIIANCHGDISVMAHMAFARLAIWYPHDALRQLILDMIAIKEDSDAV